MLQVREEVSFTKGRIIVRGKLVTRGQAKRADYILYYKPNIPIAIIEAKDNSHSVGDGMQQALDYAETLNIPFVFSSNGDGFVFHDRTDASTPRETNLALDEFPSPAELWARYRAWKGLTPEAEKIVLQDYHEGGDDKAPRYYQVNAVNAAIEAIAKGQDRILLVMATGTGKTYTAFQIIWRLWKSGDRRRILFLADRNVLVDQTMVNDFRPFGEAPPSRSSGGCGSRETGDASCSSPTATCWSTRQWLTTSAPSAKRWPSCLRVPRPSNTMAVPSVSMPPTRSISGSTRQSPGRRTIRKSTASSLAASST